MFLISPTARGETTEALSAFVSNVRSACRETISAKLYVWRGLSDTNRDRLAAVLCEDDRVLWPFSESRFGSSVIPYEEQLRTHRPYAPILIGLVGASKREALLAANAVRAVLYPLSDSVYSWTGDRKKLHEWQDDFKGGKFGGVLQVKIEGAADNEAKQNADIRLATEAMTYAIAYRMDNYVLMLSSPDNLSSRFRIARDLIKWVQFEPTDCDRFLRF